MSMDQAPDRTDGEPLVVPTQTINVGFTLQNGTDPTFTFDRHTLIFTDNGGTHGAIYRVTFHLDSDIPGAVLKAEEQDIRADPPPHLTIVSGDETSDLTIGFDNIGLQGMGTFHYEVTVLANGQSYTSQDPEIIIPPPT